MRIVSAQKADHKLVLYTKDAACILDERSARHPEQLCREDTLRGLVSGAAAWPCLELGDPAGLADAYAGEVKPGQPAEHCRAGVPGAGHRLPGAVRPAAEQAAV